MNFTLATFFGRCLLGFIFVVVVVLLLFFLGRASPRGRTVTPARTPAGAIRRHSGPIYCRAGIAALRLVSDVLV